MAVKVLNFAFLIGFVCILSTGCTLTGVKQGDVISLRGFGSGKVKFTDGAEIEKGLITFPDLKIDN